MRWCRHHAVVQTSLESWPFFTSNRAGCRVDNVLQRCSRCFPLATSSGRRVVRQSGNASSCSALAQAPAPPSAWYRWRMRLKIPARISPSFSASPGASAPFQCHCNQRPELTIEPFSSAKQVDGKRNTSVWIFDGSHHSISPWFCQKLDGFSDQRVDGHEEFQLATVTCDNFVFVRERGDRVKALADDSRSLCSGSSSRSIAGRRSPGPTSATSHKPQLFSVVRIVAKERFHHARRRISDSCPNSSPGLAAWLSACLPAR